MSENPKRGKWMFKIIEPHRYAKFVCSECEYCPITVEGYNYCPNCGSRNEKDW